MLIDQLYCYSCDIVLLPARKNTLMPEVLLHLSRSFLFERKEGFYYCLLLNQKIFSSIYIEKEVFQDLRRLLL